MYCFNYIDIFLLLYLVIIVKSNWSFGTTSHYSCPDGTQPVGSCVENKCGYGFYCLNGICCKNLYLNTPKCLDGNEALSACINGNCGSGGVCTTGNLCCQAYASLCPKSLYYISECINNQCPVGYTCFGSPPSAYCCGNQQPITCSSIDSNGQQCATNSNCPDGFLCDVLNQRCCPNLGVNPTSQGPCLSGGVCPTGQFCLQSDQNCYILYTTRAVPVSSTLTTTITATTTTATTTPTQALSITCDSGWTYFQDTMSCYKVGHNQNFQAAEADCVSQGGHLASVHSQVEDDFLIAFSKSGFVYPAGLNLDTQVFVGGIDSNLMDGVCSYMWTDGTPFDYMNFYPTEPNNCDGEGCLEIMTDNHVDKTDIAGLWNNIACDLVLRAYICKKAVNS